MHQQSLARVLAPAKRQPALLLVRPTDVARALSMTCLTAHTDLRPRRREPILLRIVVLAHTSGMAFRAHEVPGLVQSGPVQNIIVLDRFICREMKPSLATDRKSTRLNSSHQIISYAV